jgi:hypothetical protein
LEVGWKICRRLKDCNYLFLHIINGIKYLLEISRAWGNICREQKSHKSKFETEQILKEQFPRESVS